jgi:hypothetical protein
VRRCVISVALAQAVAVRAPVEQLNAGHMWGGAPMTIDSMVALPRWVPRWHGLPSLLG